MDISLHDSLIIQLEKAKETLEFIYERDPSTQNFYTYQGIVRAIDYEEKNGFNSSEELMTFLNNYNK